MAVVQTPEGYRWVSCGKALDVSVARFRHLTRQMSNANWVDTRCGASGTPGSLRTDNIKAPCPECCKSAGITLPKT